METVEVKDLVVLVNRKRSYYDYILENEKIKLSGYFDSCIATRGVFAVKAASNIAILSQFIY